MTVHGVSKLPDVTVPFKDMTGSVSGENGTTVNSVVSRSSIPTYLKCTKGITLERSLISVRYAVRNFFVPLSCKDIKELIREKDPINVSTALSPLDALVIFKSTKELTLERGPMSVHSVGRL